MTDAVGIQSSREDMHRRPLVVGNWKMHGLMSSLPIIHDIDCASARYPTVDVGLALPFTLVNMGVRAVEQVWIGGQNRHAEREGAFTGDTSAQMLRDCGARFVVLGHSERRLHSAESDSMVRDKAQAAMEQGLCALVCVGESLADREAGRAEDVVSAQLVSSVPQWLPDTALLVIAYEPIWAIGSGKVPSANQIACMHSAIRETLRAYCADDAGLVRLLYGGSVNGDNARDILAIVNVDGVLVGNASRDPRQFCSIIATADSLI